MLHFSLKQFNWTFVHQKASEWLNLYMTTELELSMYMSKAAKAFHGLSPWISDLYREEMYMKTC